MWNKNFEEYKRLRDTKQPITIKENKLLYNWQQQQKQKYKKGKLSAEQILLLKPYIDFENVKSKSENWAEIFQEFKKLRDTNQPITVKENDVFYRWKQTQKEFYKRNLLLEERINLLKPYIDFENLKTLDDIQNQWYINFEEYKLLRDTNQPITKTENTFYSTWEAWQKGNYKKCKLTEEQILLLKPYIDFEKIKTHTQSWLQTFEEYKTLCNTNQPINYKTNVLYYNWEQNQKAAYKTGKLTEERINLLKPYIDFK